MREIILGNFFLLSRVKTNCDFELVFFIFKIFLMKIISWYDNVARNDHRFTCNKRMLI